MDNETIASLIQQNLKRNSRTALILTGLSLGIGIIVTITLFASTSQTQESRAFIKAAILFDTFTFVIFLASLFRFFNPQKVQIHNIASARVVYLFKKIPGSRQKINLHANVFLKADRKKYSFPIPRGRAERLTIFLKKNGANIKVEESQIRKTVIT